MSSIARALNGTPRRHLQTGLAEDWSLLFVVHVVHEADTLRIISARRATASERSIYEHE
jgi:uncharacterized DUF497 family protein